MNNEQMELPLDNGSQNIEEKVSENEISTDNAKTIGKSMFVSAYKLVKDKSIKKEYLVENLIAKGGLCLIVGPSDTGKSIFARQLATSIALEREEIIGLKLRTKHNRAVYITTEDEKASWKEKIEKYEIDEIEQVKLENLSLVFDEFNYKALDEELTEKPADLVVMDVFSDVFTGDLNNPVHVRAFFKPYRTLAQKHGCSFVFIHHVTKKGEQGSASKLNVSGSQAIEAKMRCVLELRKDPTDDDARHLIITKGNDFKPSEKKMSRKLLINSKLEFEDTGDKAFINDLSSSKSYSKDPKVIEQILFLAGENKSVREISKILTEQGTPVSKTMVNEIINNHKK